MVGPKGRCSSRVQAWPTMTGLMNSGTIRIDMISPRPRKVAHHGQRDRQAEHELDGDAHAGKHAVSTSDQRATGSNTTRSKFFRPTKAWPGTWKS